MLASFYTDSISILDTTTNFTEITNIKLDIDIREVYISPDNKILAIVEWNSKNKNAIHIIKNNVFLKKLDSSVSCYNTICFSPDSKYLASENKNNIIIWDCDNNFDDIINILINARYIVSLKYSIDGRFLLVRTTENNLIFLDSYNNYIEEFLLHDVNDFILSPCGKFLVYYTSIDTIIILDCYRNFSILKTIPTLYPDIAMIEFSADDNFLVIGRYTGEITIFDCNKDFKQTSILNVNEDIQNLCFSPINNDSCKIRK